MSILVRVPATSANLGSGVDCMGVALALYLNVSFQKEDLPDFRFDFRFPDCPARTVRPEDNYILTGIRLAEQALCRRVPVCRVTVRSDIPLARGLGSSASALLAGILGAYALCGVPLDRQKALELATRAEGHPDNAAPALLGGFTVASGNADGLFIQKLKVDTDALRAIVLIPSFPLSTESMRKVLPDSVPLKDAVSQVQHACLLVSALQNGDWRALNEASDDRLFTPYRQAHMPYLARVFEAGAGAGALCCMISGSGPTVLALAEGERSAQDVRKAFERTASDLNLPAEVRILAVDRDGANTSAEGENEG